MIDLNVVEALPTEAIVFITGINEKINLNGPIAIQAIISFVESVIERNYYGLKFHVLQYEFIVQLLSFAPESDYKRKILDKYINLILAIDPLIIKNHFYSDYEKWIDMLKSLSTDNAGLLDNYKYNVEEYKLHPFYSEKVLMIV
jgi:hypothetical protein